jgi:ABC-type Fe3+ transport system substrate-binding protein
MVFAHSLIRTTLAFAAIAAACVPARAADDALIAAARREGRVVWYTTQIIDQLSKPIGEAFERAYGVKVDYVRSDANEAARRILTESSAGHMQADVFDGVASPALVKQNLVMDYTPESTRRLPRKYVDASGHWLATNLYVYTLGVNTDLVPKGTEPKTFADLLAPKFRGRMAWSGRTSTSSAPGFIGAALASMGDAKGMDCLRALAKQEIAPVSVSARQLLDQTIAGEYAIALEILNNHAAISAAQGAPVAWAPLELNLVALSVISATREAPHPNTAKLFLDFVMSPEGQTIYRDRAYIPVDPEIPPRDPRLRPDGVELRGYDIAPDALEAALPKWFAIYKDIFR